MNEKGLKQIRQSLPQLKLLENEPMSAHCSFRIGGPAAMAVPENETQLLELLALLHAMGEHPLFLGRGTNVLFSDSGTSRLVICPGSGFQTKEPVEGNRIQAGCGVTLAGLACFARDCGLSGLEFAHGIPGSLGGAVFMNAGAYGGEMADVLESVRFYDSARKEICTLPVSALELGYRTSCFAGTENIILSAVVQLTPAEPAEITARMRELAEKRRASQPLDKPSAGSTFKRPKTGYAAAMIDACGLKGYSVGGAQVSPKHAGFVVNNGGATCKDVLALMEHIRETVLREQGVELEPEVRIIRS